MGSDTRWLALSAVALCFCFGLYVNQSSIGHFQLQMPRDLNIEVEEIGIEATEEGGKHTKGKEGDPLFVILLSSLPRSGSTMVAELLSSFRHNSVLFFEPLSGRKQKGGVRKGAHVADFLRTLSDCSFEQDFNCWLKRKALFLQYFHPKAVRCFQRPEEGVSLCKRNLNLKSLCQETDVRIAKVIRSRLSWLGGLMGEKASRTKIIYLTRDPRGSITSASSLGWRKNVASHCLDFDSDMKDFDELAGRYPTKLHRLSLEELSLNPVPVTERVSSFLFGDRMLPPTTLWFLESHLRARRPTSGSMSTHRDGRKEYQSWRWEISAHMLQEVEEDPACKRTIQRLGHVVFGSWKAVRNSSLPLNLGDGVLTYDFSVGIN